MHVLGNREHMMRNIIYVVTKSIHMMIAEECYTYDLDLDLSNFIVVLYKVTTKGLSQKQSFAYQGLFSKYK